MRPRKEPLQIVVDSRERLPFLYKTAFTRTLKTGDYSVLGLEDRVTIERKRVGELFQCAGRDRKRFERELERLSSFEYAAIVIEGDLADILKPQQFSQVSPRTVVSSLVSWSVRFGVHVYFAGSRPLARALTYRILEKFSKYRGVNHGK
jgi:ERCC4-type nuclease